MEKPPLTKVQKVMYALIVLAILVGYFDYIEPAIKAQDDYKICLEMWTGIGKNPDDTFRYCEAYRYALRECGRVFFKGHCDESSRQLNYVESVVFK